MDIQKNCLWLLLLDDDDEEDTLIMMKTNKQKKVHNMFQNRVREGAFNNLIKRHLIDDDTKFREYFRLTPHLFNYVLTFIRNDITPKVSNRHNKPISPEEKLCITLRLVFFSFQCLINLNHCPFQIFGYWRIVSVFSIPISNM